MTRHLPARVVAEMLGVKTSTLAKWRRADPPRGPQQFFHLTATLVVYEAAAVEAYLQERKRTGFGD